MRAFNFESMLRRAVLTLPVLLIFTGACEASLASAEDHFRSALELRFRGNTDAAMAEYRRGLESDPGSVDGHVQLGVLLLDEKGDIDAAISEFVTALAIDPACKFCQLRLNEALERKNSKAADQVQRGNQLYAAGEIGRAAAAYRIAALIDPDDAVAHNSLAWTLYRLGDLDQGLKEINQALTLKPSDPEFVNTLACLQFDRGEVDKAIGTWRRAIKLSKTPAAADLYGLAVGFLSKGDTASAARYFAEATRIDPKYRDAQYVRDRVGMSVHALANHDKLLSLVAEK